MNTHYFSIAPLQLFLFLTSFFVLHGNHSSEIDRYAQEYVASMRHDEKKSKQVNQIFSYLTPLYEEQNIVSYQTYQNLSLASQQGHTLTSILESELAPCTCTGKVTLFLTLMHPTTDISVLEQRQKLVRFFINHQQVIPIFTKMLSEIHGHEHALLLLRDQQQLSLSAQQAQLVEVRTLLDTLFIFIQATEALNVVTEYPVFQELQDILVMTHPFAILRHFLHKSTFTAASAFFFNPFSVITARRIYKNIPALLISKLLHCIGHIDLAIATARLLVNQKDHYCFAQFVNENRPVFSIKQGWNPLLLAHKQKVEITKNDFAFSPEKRTLVVTGPNTSGKTVITCGFATAVLLAQALGIAPATHFVLTPFNIIYTILTATSEISRGNSRFASEVHRIKQLLEDLETAYAAQKFAFVVLDEIFTGTDPKSGERAAIVFLDRYFESHVDEYTLLFLSTHYTQLTKMASQYPTCANYKIDITRKPHGILERNFILEPGISDFPITTQFLQEAFSQPKK